MVAVPVGDEERRHAQGDDGDVTQQKAATNAIRPQKPKTREGEPAQESKAAEKRDPERSRHETELVGVLDLRVLPVIPQHRQLADREARDVRRVSHREAARLLGPVPRARPSHHERRGRRRVAMRPRLGEPPDTEHDA